MVTEKVGGHVHRSVAGKDFFLADTMFQAADSQLHAEAKFQKYRRTCTVSVDASNHSELSTASGLTR